MEQWESKAHAASRRRQNLERIRDGVSYAPRVIPGHEYRRSFKHRPRSAEDWDELD